MTLKALVPVSADLTCKYRTNRVLLLLMLLTTQLVNGEAFAPEPAPSNFEFRFVIHNYSILVKFEYLSAMVIDCVVGFPIFLSSTFLASSSFSDFDIIIINVSDYNKMDI